MLFTENCQRAITYVRFSCAPPIWCGALWIIRTNIVDVYMIIRSRETRDTNTNTHTDRNRRHRWCSPLTCTNPTVRRMPSERLVFHQTAHTHASFTPHTLRFSLLLRSIRAHTVRIRERERACVSACVCVCERCAVCSIEHVARVCSLTSRMRTQSVIMLHGVRVRVRVCECACFCCVPLASPMHSPGRKKYRE